ncbi:hypothetical protein SAMN02745225_02292 [Ferrithrix thermotolerans DSM 19514]|uniref:Transposase DDE domain-containing protein n=1 Tax=Ferrithrix thermotolerans DSM 19514 TaxID=1121881 RepID=A0A1M4YBC1_9ACTN|nr:hypothetical protein [Ferrithrix thermotolerans]SHF02959.1 hypothetical protein SAMN02745225_02292 [Ferrithrix thermotolerans DSM 19514]
MIETNKEGLSNEEIWHLYMTLTRVEEAFRALKSDLGLRPLYHQLARRTCAHLFISVLAYHLYGAIAYELTTKTDTRRPLTILARLATHVRATVTLTDIERKVHHLRVSNTPDPDQRQIFGDYIFDTLTTTMRQLRLFVHAGHGARRPHPSRVWKVTEPDGL